MLCVGGMRAALLLFGSPPQSGDAAADSGERQYCMHVTEQQNHLYPMSYVHALHNVSFYRNLQCDNNCHSNAPIVSCILFENSCHFCEFTQLSKQLFLSQLDINHVTQELTAQN